MSWLPRAPTIKACFPRLNKMSHASLSQTSLDLVGDEGAVEASSCRP